MRSRALTAVTGLSFVLAVAASVLLIRAPAYSTETMTDSSGDAPVVLHATTTLAQVNGHWVYWLLAVPPALAAASVVASVTPARRFLLPGLAASLMAFALVSGMSIGLFYLPAAVTLLVAAAVVVSTPRPEGRSRQDPAS